MKWVMSDGCDVGVFLGMMKVVHLLKLKNLEWMIVILIQFSFNLSKKKSFLLTGRDSFLYAILDLFSIESLVTTLSIQRGWTRKEMRR